MSETNAIKTGDEILARNASVKKRAVSAKAGEIGIYFVPQLTDRQGLADYIIKPLLAYVHSGGEDISAENLMTRVLQFDVMETGDDLAKAEGEILDGMTVMLLPIGNEYIVFNTKNVEKKAIESPQISYAMRAPKDCFTESMETNLSLIRYRIKDHNLKSDKLSVGERTKTNVVLMYLGDVANDGCVNELKERIGKIVVDGVIDSGELQSFLVDRKFSLFPQMGVCERSDAACQSILEGKVVILVEGSGLALVAPKTFHEYFMSEDDLYENKFYGAFSKIFRYVAIAAAVMLVPFYVAMVAFNSGILSPGYVVTLAALRSAVPFNVLTEALLVTFVMELLRECLIRVPKQIGSAIGITAAIIIGQAAVSAGIFSPLILIFASLSLLTSFVAADYTIENSFRIIKFALILFAGVFGFYGIALGLFVVLVKMASSESFGVPFVAPYSPFNLKEFLKTFFSSKTDSTMRPRYLHPKDLKRGEKNG